MIISALLTRLAAYRNRRNLLRIAQRLREFSIRDKKLFRGHIIAAGDGRVNLGTCSIVVGDGSLLLCHVCFERDGASLKVGDNTFIGSSELIISTGITIGNNVLISNGCMIQDHDSHPSESDLRRLDLPALLEGRHKDWSRVKCQPITIEGDAWIGARAMVLKGVIVGTGSIIGAGAVVARKVAPSSTVVGNPAREI